MIKQKVFETMDLMYQTQMITKFSYQILLLIEFVQMLYYSVQQTYLFNTNYFIYFVEAISYFQPLKYLTTVDQNIFSVFVIFSFVYLTIVTGLLIYILVSDKSMVVIYATRIYNVMMVGEITLFIMPFISIFLATYRCEGTMQCDSIFYYILIILASISLVLLIISVIFFEIFLIDYNPFTPIAYASKYTKLNWIELIFKIYLPFFAVMDSNQDAEKPFIIILTIMYFSMITMRLKTRQFIENSINISKLCQTSLLFWASFVSVCHAFLDEGPVDNMGFFYEVICSPIVVYCCFKLNKSPELITHIKKDIQLEETLQEMIHLIENKDKPLNRMKLEGFVKLHQKDCLKSVEQCPCQLIHQDTLRNEDNEKLNDKQAFDRTTRWYSFLQALIQNSSDRFQTTRIQIIRAYILQKKLKNKFKAFYELAIAQKQRVQFQDEFCIYRVLNQIELEMIEQDKNQEIDVQQIVNFQNYYIQFETSIEKSVNLHLEYWRELQEESPDIGKLQQLGSSITQSIDETEQLYEKLIKINSIHLKTLEIYGNFLTHVVNNDIEGNRIIDKSDQISKNLEINRIIDSEKFKYDQNSDTCIITCSVNIDNLGAVTNCNNEIQKLLGYKKADLLRQNVSRIMPRILAGVHDDFIRSFIQTSQSKVLGIERQVFALNKNGFLVPCSLMIRVLPNLKSGLQIVGFLKKSDNTDQYYYLMFDEFTHSILGFSESVYDKFGIPVGVANGQLDLPVGDIASELIDTCKKQGAFNFTIDTTVLLTNYQIVQDDSLDDVQQQEDQSAFYGISRDPYEQNLLLDRKEYSQINEKTAQNDKSNINDRSIYNTEKQTNHKSSKFKSALVKGLLVEDSEYASAKIKIIQFIEESEELIINNKEMEEKKIEEQPDVVENLIQSEVSGGSGLSVNEEIRQIKEFKIQMGEKSEASKIIFLNRITMLLSLILIVLSSIQLGYRLQQNDELLNGQLAIFTAYYRNSVMADVIFYTRYLQLMAKGNVTYDQTFRDKLSLQVNSLKSIQYSLIKYQIDMESKKNMFTDTSLNVSYLYDQTEQNYTSTLSDAIFQLVTSASIIRNASLSSFTDQNSTENTLKNVFFIIRNGYQLLRVGAQDYAQIYYDFFIFIIGNYDTIFYVVLSFAVASLVIAQFFLIPVVLRVHNINNQVMSLFGLLSQKDIKELATRSEQFKITYLSNMQNTIKEQQQIKAEQDKQIIKQQKFKDQDQNDQSNVIMEINNENPPQSIDPQITPHQQKQPLNSALPTSKNINDKPTLQQKQLQDHEEQQILDQEASRQQKLLNSKSSTTFTVSLKLIVMMLIFMTYFIVNVVLEQQLVNQSSIIYNHLKYSTIRSYDLKYSIYFTVESILQQTNYKNEYIADLYENERLCLESLQQDFSSAFNSYIKIYNQFNLQSLCLQAFSTDQFTLDVNQCSILSGGILDRGLRNSITSLVLWASNTITTDLKILDSQQVKNYIEQVYYIDQAILYLNAEYESAMGDFVDSQQQLEKIKFAIFIIGLVFIFLFIWTPYNQEMSRQIWRTKGMLNMIPFEMIKAQESLKNAFLKGNIIANVK